MVDHANKIDLSGQVALVTGGGRGLGRALAQALAAAGAGVAVVARSEDQLSETVRLIEKDGGCAVMLPADVSDQQAVQRVVACVEEQLGPIDLLVNNAAVMGPASGPLWEVAPDEWWRTVEINLRGPFLCAWAALPGMVSRSRGRIINVTSSIKQGPYVTAYHAAKAALTHLTDCLAVETEGYGVSVFALYPGSVRTAVTEYLADSPEVHESLRERVQEQFRDGTMSDSLERAVKRCMFLASGRADALSGRYISVFDNEEELLRRADEIRRDDLLALRVRPLPSSSGNGTEDQPQNVEIRTVTLR